LAYSFLYGLALLGVGASLRYLPEAVASVAAVAIMLAGAIFVGSLTIRRVHDFDEGGWFALLFLVPIANLYVTFAPGSPMPNRFGDRPPLASFPLRVAALMSLAWPFVFMAVIMFVPEVRRYF
jgi:uncharacterized membrane protein YhaH (DUF805 family)